MTLDDCIRSIELRLLEILHPCEVVHGFTMREIVETFVWTEFISLRGTSYFPQWVSDTLKSSSFAAVQDSLGPSEVDYISQVEKGSSPFFLKCCLTFRRTGDVFQINSPMHEGRSFPVSYGPTKNDLKKVFKMVHVRDIIEIL